MFGLSIGDLLALTFGTGVVTTAMVTAADYFSRSRQKKEQAAYLAMRLSNILETYWQNCSRYIGDNQIHRDSEGHAGVRRASMPELPTFPDDPDGWRSLRIDLADRALAFPNAVASSEAFLDFYWNVVGEDATGACDSECAIIGVVAIDLSDSLRSAFDLPNSRSPLNQRRVADLRVTAAEERERRKLD